MANAEHLTTLRQGVDAWNAWREKERQVRPDLGEANLSGANLSATNFSGANLSATNFSGADLRGANFSEADLNRAYLRWADLHGANFSEANLSGADLSATNLSGADLSATNFSGADLRGANFSGAILRGANFLEADLSATNLSGADLRGAILSGADLRGANFLEANLGEADLSRADLSRADLHEADLRAADLSGAILSGAILHRAHLRGADLRAADLSGAILGGAILHRADLGGAILHGVDLGGAILHGADLSTADLHGADLERAKLEGTKLNQAILKRANLIDAYLDGADLTGAKLWETQRGGWSIKNVICRVAFWDREGKEPTKYEEGEFERIFAEKPRIILRYAGGISPIDLLALPLVVERLQAQYPGSVLQIHSMQNDAGGASVTLTVEDRENRGIEVFAAEVEALRRDVLTWRVKYQTVMGDVLPMLLERTAAMIKGDTYNIHGQAGAVGPSAHAHDNVFQQIQAGIDLPKLAEELEHLRNAMKAESTGTREQDKAIGTVADAEDAAIRGDGPAALQYLKSAGEWTLGIAEKIGVGVAIEALKRAM